MRNSSSFVDIPLPEKTNYLNARAYFENGIIRFSNEKYRSSSNRITDEQIYCQDIIFEIYIPEIFSHLSKFPKHGFFVF